MQVGSKVCENGIRRPVMAGVRGSRLILQCGASRGRLGVGVLAFCRLLILVILMGGESGDLSWMRRMSNPGREIVNEIRDFGFGELDLYSWKEIWCCE